MLEGRSNLRPGLVPVVAGCSGPGVTRGDSEQTELILTVLANRAGRGGWRGITE